MSVDSLVSLGQREWEFIRANLNYLLDLPEPGAEWVVAEQPPGVNPRLNHLIQRGFIQKQGRTTPGPWETYRYTTTPEAYDAIQTEHSRRDLLPCGHTGVANHGDGEYGCGYEYCTVVHDRDVVEEVLES